MQRSVLVTGASKGIGHATAILLAKKGWRVFAGYRAEADARRLGALENVLPVRLDVTRADDIANAARTVDVALDGEPLHGVVDNAGIAAAGPLEFIPIARLRTQLEINVIGQVAVTQAFLPALRRGPGRIVLVGSIAGISSLPFMGPYGASKHALEAIADSWRVELRPFGIEVVLIQPGVIATPIWETSIAEGERSLENTPPEMDAYYGERLAAIRRTAEKGMGGLPPERVAEVIERALTAARPRTRYLVGRDARFRAVLQRLLPDRLRDALIARALRRL